MSTLRRKIIGDLRAQAGAFLAVWLTAVFGLSFYGSTYPAGVAMIDSFDATYEQLNYADFNAHFDPAPPEEIVQAISDIEGVEAVEGRLVVDGGLELQAPDRLTLHMISFPNEGHPAVNNVLVTEGEELTSTSELLLLESFANYHDIEPGDTLHIWVNDQPFDLIVSGLVFAPEYLVAGQSPVMPFPQPSSFGVAYLRHNYLSAMLDYEGEINDVVLTIDADADEDAVRAELESVLEPYTIEFVYSRVQTASGGVMDANIRGNMAIAAVFSAIFLSIGGLVMAILLARLMDAETRRIGTMRALGLSRGEALRHYLAFPLIIGVSSAVVGSIAGYLSSFFVAYYIIEVVLGGSLPTFVNSPQWVVIFLGAAVTIALAFLAAIIPTWRASGTDPGLALRPVTPKGMGAQARISIPGLPLAARQALRNIFRVPIRTINTLVGVTLGFTVIISASGMADSTIRFQTVQFDEGQFFDLQTTWAKLTPAASLEEQVTRIPGVSDVEMVLAGPVTTRFGEHSLDTLAVSIDHETDYYAFETIRGESTFSHGEGVWIGHNLSRVIGVDVGDTLIMDAMGQTQEAQVAGVVNQGIGSMVYVPSVMMAEWTFGIPISNMALVRAEPDSLDDVRRTLGGLDGVIAVDDVALSTQDLNNYMSLYINMPRIFLIFGYVLTLLVVFNTVSINLHERREELAIMRSMGATIGEIARAVTWEMMSVTMIGILLGVPLGWYALDTLMNNYDLDFFGLLNYIAPATYALAVFGIIAVVLLAEWLGLRSIRKMELGYLSKSLSM